MTLLNQVIEIYSRTHRVFQRDASPFWTALTRSAQRTIAVRPSVGTIKSATHLGASVTNVGEASEPDKEGEAIQPTRSMIGSQPSSEEDSVPSTMTLDQFVEQELRDFGESQNLELPAAFMDEIQGGQDNPELRRILTNAIQDDRVFSGHFGGPSFFLKELTAMVAGLPRLQRIAIEETVMKGRTLADVARELGITHQAVSMAKRGGLKHLSDWVKQESDRKREGAMAGKFEVYEARDGFRFRLKAGNGEVVATGEAYTTRDGAHKGCEAVQRAAAGAAIEDK